MSNRTSWGVTLLRIAVASVFVVHGLTRCANGTVGGFGEYLSASGFPAGTALAWTLTLVEILGGLALAAGVLVLPLCGWFGAQILTGILMIHGRAGWFVVGAGRNGAEYSVLILACLAATALADPIAHRLDRRASADISDR
jgi:putative oxidoreductase